MPPGARPSSNVSDRGAHPSGNVSERGARSSGNVLDRGSSNAKARQPSGPRPSNSSVSDRGSSSTNARDRTKAAMIRKLTAGKGAKKLTSREAFDQLDKDGSGLLSLDELKAFLTSSGDAGAPLSEKDVTDVITHFDASGDGAISYSEFLTMWADDAGQQPPAALQPVPENGKVSMSVMDAFRVFDKDGSGALSADELKAIFKRPGGGSPLSDADIAEIIAMFDTNGGEPPRHVGPTASRGRVCSHPWPSLRLYGWSSLPGPLSRPAPRPAAHAPCLLMGARDRSRRRRGGGW